MFWCMSFMRFLMLDFGISSFASLPMECLCMALLTPAVMVMRGLVFHPLFRMVSFGESYLACLWVRACLGNLSWQYVNPMNCTV